ncbi:MAG: helix-turn-helix transcriptional regulator [Legionellaceae bacterium]|nr:helix-turn-helix transcriptional regulator [Legionellaceae bacterium]
MNEEKKNLSDRINHALIVTGTKKADLARAIGVKPQVIQFLCNSETQSSRFTFEIATALGLNTRWLATGNGEMFLADDPSKQFLKLYEKVPLLQGEELRNFCLRGKKLDDVITNTWLPLKTPHSSIFAVKMPDASMEPYLPANSNLFILKSQDITRSAYKFAFLYLSKFDTFIVREIILSGNSTILKPKNTELFKEVKFDHDVTMLGLVTDCFWHIGS